MFFVGEAPQRWWTHDDGRESWLPAIARRNPRKKQNRRGRVPDGLLYNTGGVAAPLPRQMTGLPTNTGI
jgi:hypothetical protein